MFSAFTFLGPITAFSLQNLPASRPSVVPEKVSRPSGLSGSDFAVLSLFPRMFPFILFFFLFRLQHQPGAVAVLP